MNEDINQPVTLKQLRESAGYSQAKLGERIGVSQSAIKFWESGQREPTITNVIALAKTFNVSLRTICLSMGLDVTGIPSDGDDLPWHTNTLKMARGMITTPRHKHQHTLSFYCVMAKLKGDQTSLFSRGFSPDYFLDRGDPGWDNLPSPKPPQIAEQHSASLPESGGKIAEQYSANLPESGAKIAEQYSARIPEIAEQYSVSAILATLELLTPGELAKVINRSLRVQNDRDGKPDAGHIELKQRGNNFYRYLRYWDNGKLKCKYLGRA